MKKIILVGLLAGVPAFNAVYADSTLPIVKVNCDDVKLSLNTVMNDKLNFGAYWNDTATFPNPPKYTEIGDSKFSKIRKFRIDCPRFTASYDGNIAEVKAESYSAVLEKFSKFDLEPHLYSISGYKYPNIKKGFFNISYSINLSNFNLKTSIFDLKEGEDVGKDLTKSTAIKKGSIIGYKVDGSELRPLLYDMKVGNYKNDFEAAKKIDIYHKVSGSEAGVIIQRIFIDKENGILRIYGKSSFPSN